MCLVRKSVQTRIAGLKVVKPWFQVIPDLLRQSLYVGVTGGFNQKQISSNLKEVIDEKNEDEDL